MLLLVVVHVVVAILDQLVCLVRVGIDGVEEHERPASPPLRDELENCLNVKFHLLSLRVFYRYVLLREEQVVLDVIAVIA